MVRADALGPTFRYRGRGRRAGCRRGPWGAIRSRMAADVGRDGHVVGPRVHHVEGRFRLGQKMVPLVDGEVGMGAHKNRETMVPKRLDCALGFVGAFLVWRYAIYRNALLFEES
jgi:hypothetical protein